MSRNWKAVLLVSALMLMCIAVTQLQPTALRFSGAVDGSFGIRPMSHRCAGLQIEGASIDWLPAADIRFSFGRFSFRYRVDEPASPERSYCIGQDIWFGE